MSIDLDEIIKALAHPVRRDILTWLKDPKVQFPEQLHNHEYGICAGQIDQRCGFVPVDRVGPPGHLATGGFDQQPEGRAVALFQTQRGSDPGFPHGAHR
ncbi:hypothetical protein VRB14_06435 [Pseudomonas trivialis]